METDEGEACLPTNKTSHGQAEARGTFMKNNLSACSAFTGYVAAGDARRTQPLLKLEDFETPRRATELRAQTHAHMLTDT